MPNRLATESSPYLRQHADDPVDWWPWCQAALDAARREDKPIFLSIGYSACHWCHVMARESFGDPRIAEQLREGFIAVKVDRELRPDLDQLYQAVVQVLGRGGGWPLSVFLTPSGAPFFGGTYFPPVARRGMPAFSEVLDAVRGAWRDKRDDVAAQAADLVEAVQRLGAGRGEPSANGVGPELLARAAERLTARFDDEHGGFGDRPKFPSTMSLDVLLRRAVEDRDPAAEARGARALDAMADGGLREQLAGGFHRYSTDARWLVPHFEKMLYDNALLLRLYVDAGRALSSTAYLDVARDTAEYVVRELATPGGALLASTDADSDGGEGRAFVWTPDEIDRAVSSPLGRDVVKLHFGVEPAGNFERTGASVLAVAEPLSRVAVRLGRAPSDVSLALDDARRELLAARALRPQPACDDKRITAWNSLAIGALAEAGLALGEARFRRAAERALADVLAHAEREGRVARAFDRDGVATELGFLDDHAGLANAALDLAEATGDPSLVGVARRIVDVAVSRFDDGNGGLLLAPRDGERLVAALPDPWDQSTPSGESLLALALLRLGALVDPAYHARGAAIVERLSAPARANPFAFGKLLAAVDWLVRGPVEVVVLGEPGSARDALVEAVGARWIPNRSLVVASPSTAHHVPLATAGKPWPPAGAAVAYVCRLGACSAPVATADELSRLLGA